MSKKLCKRCGHSWISRKDREPIICPNCKSAYWNLEKLTYEHVNIKTTLEEFVEKIKQEKVSVNFKITELKYKQSPLYDNMRDQLKDDECWDELLKLDKDGQFPPLRYEENQEDQELIDEVVDMVRTQHWALDKTEIKFLKENRSEYFSGTNGKLRMVLKYIGS